MYRTTVLYPILWVSLDGFLAYLCCHDAAVASNALYMGLVTDADQKVRRNHNIGASYYAHIYFKNI